MVSSISNSSGNISQMMQMMMQSMQQRQDDMFKKIDSSGDGKIDKTEFSDLAKKMSEMSGSSINADNAFTKYDANKDGTLSKEELASFMKDNAPAPPDGMSGAMGQTGMQGSQSMFDNMFSKIDSSGDGKVDKTEFSAMTKKMSEMSGSSINTDEAFTKYDANKDGTLSKDELASFMKDNAPAPPAGIVGGMSQSGGSSKSSSASNDPKDTNHDGTVSAAEELAYDLTHSASSAYGSNSSDQLSQLMDMLQKNSASDSNGASKEAGSKNDYMSKLLDALKSLSSSNGTGNVSLISINA